MNYQELISLLETNGQGTKQQVLWMLKNATVEELIDLRNSINEEIRKKRVGNIHE